MQRQMREWVESEMVQLRKHRKQRFIIKFGTHIHVPFMMNCNKCGDADFSSGQKSVHNQIPEKPMIFPQFYTLS